MLATADVVVALFDDQTFGILPWILECIHIVYNQSNMQSFFYLASYLPA